VTKGKCEIVLQYLNEQTRAIQALQDDLKRGAGKVLAERGPYPNTHDKLCLIHSFNIEVCNIIYGELDGAAQEEEPCQTAN